MTEKQKELSSTTLHVARYLGSVINRRHRVNGALAICSVDRNKPVGVRKALWKAHVHKKYPSAVIEVFIAEKSWL